MKELDLPEFNPQSQSFKENIYPIYKIYRKYAPVYYREEYDDWIITRYDDVKHCMENPLLRSPSMGKPFTSIDLRWDELLTLNSDQKILMMQNKIQDIHNHFLGNLSPPYHTYLRQIINPFFSSQKIELLSSKIQELSNSLIEKKLKDGEMDIVNDYALPLVTRIIFDMFGLPYNDIEKLVNLTNIFVLSTELNVDKKRESKLKRKMVVLSLVNYLHPILTELRKNLKDDILSNLLIAEIEGKITYESVLGIVILLIIAGFENTINSIVLAIHCLINNHEQRVKLQNEPAIIKGAVEELLRFTSPVQSISVISRDSFKIRENLIMKSQQLNLIIGSANHDPDQFSNPDELDITRKPNQHLTFSAGNHYCVGASLARLKIEIAVMNIFKRLPEIRLTESYTELKDTYNVWGFKQLNVNF
jgi:pimeloyl-[acyl-carrier protein] synthase